MTAVTVTTANICGNPIRARWAVRARMRAALRHDGFVFGQEVAASNRFRVGRARPADYSSTWHQIARKHGKVTYGGRHEVPVSVPAEGWTIQEYRTERVHGGRRLVSPARFLTEVSATNDASGEPVAFIDCHPVSKPREGVPAASWRIRHWEEYHAALTAAVTRLHSEGYSVVFGGDMNKLNVPPIHYGQQLLVQHGLDHLWILPAAGTALMCVRQEITPRTLLMDHPILSVTFDLH